MNRETRDLFKKRNVVSVGRGKKITAGEDTGRSAIVVGVSKKVPWDALSSKDIIPSTLRGEITDVVEVGEIKALINRTRKWRPAPGGVSVGHKDITAGTLGMWVRKNGLRLVLSNNHVLANVNKGKIGDSILQPGPVDGGSAEDEIGELYAYVEIKVSGLSDCPIGKAVAGLANFLAKLLGRRTRLVAYALPGENLVDCALALPHRQEDIDHNVLEVGTPQEIAEPKVGMPVVKSGRTSGKTVGEITQIDVTVNVNMGDGRLAFFTDQFMVGGKFSQPGDSGSAIFALPAPPEVPFAVVGLLFAGSESVTVGNRLSNVARALEITLT